MRISIPAQTIKNNTLYFLSSVFVEKKKNSLCADKGHIVFDNKTNSSVCFTSCNFIRMKYLVKKDQLNFTSIVPDKDACPDPLIGLEQDLKSLLPKVTSYKCVDKQLVFFNKSDTLMVFSEKEIGKK